MLQDTRIPFKEKKKQKQNKEKTTFHHFVTFKRTQPQVVDKLNMKIYTQTATRSGKKIANTFFCNSLFS